MLRIFFMSGTHPGLAIWLGAMLCVASACSSHPEVDSSNLSTDTIVLDDWDGPPIPLHIARPAAVGPGTPVVFVMHGVLRNASTYRDAWIDIAQACDLIAVSPEFSRDDFPGAQFYNLGGLGHDQPSAFDALDPAFETIRQHYALEQDRFSLFGHSAGAQYVHRYVLFQPASRVGRAVAANAGWYTLPSSDHVWPYGLREAPAAALPDADLVQRDVVLLLGELDNDPEAEYLRQTVEARAQGPHRFARGHFMLDVVEQRAEAAGLPANWRIATVPGVGHDNARMAGPALNHLIDENRLAQPECARLARGE